MAQQLIYIYDPMCSWCYANGGNMVKMAHRYGMHIPITILSGGMVLGDNEKKIGEWASFLTKEYDKITQHTGAIFGDAFRSNILNEGSYQLSSFWPSVALTAFKSIEPNKAIEFAHRIQQAFYLEGQSLNSFHTYKRLAREFGLDGERFAALMQMDECQKFTIDEFQTVSKWGISSFPTLVLLRDEAVLMASQGWVDEESLVRIFEQILSYDNPQAPQ